MAAEVISIDFNPQSLIRQFETVNKSLDTVEGKSGKVHDAMDRIYKGIISITDKATQSQERFIKSVEKQADLAGKSGVERLIADRDRLIKKYSQDEQAVTRLTAAYKKLIDAQKGGGENHLAEFGETFKQFIENPMGTAGNAATSLLSKLGPTAVGLGAIAGAAIAAGAALFEITKSFAENSEALVNMAASTGIEINELDKLQAMAKLTGTDIGTLARAGTAMAQSLEEGGQKGKLLADNLAKLHVSTVNFNGSQKDEGLLLVQTLQALSKVTDKTQRLGLAAEVLGPRVSKNLQPVIADMGRLEETVTALGYGIEEDGIIKGAEFQQTLHLVELAIGQLGRVIGIGVVEIANWGLELGKLVEKYDPLMKALEYLDKRKREQEENDPEVKLLKALAEGYVKYEQSIKSASQAKAGLAASKFGTSMIGGTEEGIKANIADAEKKRLDALNIINASRNGIGPGYEAEQSAEKEYRKQQNAIDSGKKSLELLSERKNFLKQLDDQQRAAGDAELSELDKINAKRDEQIAKAKTLGFSQSELAKITAKENEIATKAIDLLNKKLDERQAKELRAIDIADQRNALHQQQARIAETPIRELGSKGVTAQDIQADIERSAALKRQFAQEEHDFEVSNANDIKDEREKQLAIRRADSELTKTEGEIETARIKEQTQLEQRRIDQYKAFLEEKSKIEAGDRTDAVKSNASLQIKLTDLNKKDRPLDAAQDDYQTKVAEAQQLYALELERIRANEDGNTAILSAMRAQRELQKQMGDAQVELSFKQAEVDHQHFETVKTDLTSLYETLLTKPQNFGKQLATTLKTSITKPIAEGMAGVTSRVLQPVIYGADGKSGIAGAFHGLFGGNDRPDPLKISNDANTQATIANTDSMVTLSSYMAAGMGLPAPPTPSGVSASPVGTPSTSASSPLGAFQQMVFGGPGGRSSGGFMSGGSFIPTPPSFGGGGFGSAAPGSSDYGIPSLPGYSAPSVDSDGNPVFYSTSTASGNGDFGGEAGPGGGTGPVSSGGFGGLLKGLGGSGKGGFNLSSLTKNFKGINWGGFTHAAKYNPNGDFGGETDNPSTPSQGRINGVNGLAGAALMAGGMALAQKGLLGNDRGTGKGILEGGFGGAAIGLKYGGPLGAAIGAAVGTLAGVSEKLAGVESPLNEAKKLVKQKYGVSIDDKYAQQIVQLANSKYGGKVSLAVEDPDTRKALQLYAAGTGQKVPLGNTTPMAGNLQMQNGSITQSGASMFGQQYYQQSVFGQSQPGGTQVPGAAGTPSLLQVNVQGDSMAGFMQGQVVTPSFVSSQVSAANNYSNGRVANSAAFTGNPALTTYGS